jgi:hypothetical protein
MRLLFKLRHIWAELKGHARFTVFGALAGVLFMLLFRELGQPNASTLFSIFHPGHVLLSAMVTASIFSIHRRKKSFLLILVIGYVGSIGVATLSDSVIPYAGERLLGIHVPSHFELHGQETNEHENHDHGIQEHVHKEEKCDHRDGLHLGFIEEWYIVNPAAIFGVIIAYFLPRTKFPHAAHVLISTWASSSHILMNAEGDVTAGVIVGIFGILFVAVWLPCCISDIIFPLFFVKSDLEMNSPCQLHGIHSHPHKHSNEEDKNEGEA